METFIEESTTWDLSKALGLWPTAMANPTRDSGRVARSMDRVFTGDLKTI
jgi:hypothetical protein